MGNKVCNVAKGKARYYAQLPAANDAIKALLLVSAGLEADDALEDYTTIQAMLAASNDEATFTNYARKTLAGITDTITNGTNRWDSDANDLVWTAAGNTATAAGSGAGNNVLGKLVIYYDPDTTASSDANNIPLAVYDFVASTDGNELDATIAAAGWIGATD